MITAVVLMLYAPRFCGLAVVLVVGSILSQAAFAWRTQWDFQETLAVSAASSSIDSSFRIFRF